MFSGLVLRADWLPEDEEFVVIREFGEGLAVAHCGGLGYFCMDVGDPEEQVPFTSKDKYLSHAAIPSPRDVWIDAWDVFKAGAKIPKCPHCWHQANVAKRGTRKESSFVYRWYCYQCGVEFDDEGVVYS
jgi:hypothetical protein